MARTSLPGFIKPMLATLTDKAFNDSEWLFEIKWDGFRALAYIDKNVELISRNEKSFNLRFPTIVNDLSHIKLQTILDGEIVILDEHGKSHFQLMQNYLTTQEGLTAYYVFDILYLNGRDLRDFPLIERKEILKNLLEKTKCTFTHYSDHVLEKGQNFFEEAEKKNLEGIIAKRIDSVYTSRRSREWLKIKTHNRQEVVICGFTEPRGSRKYFGSLLLGVYKDHELVYVGHSGGGFDSKLLKSTYEKLRPLIIEECPFKKKPKTNSIATWVKPKLVCEIEFSEWTDDGRMRQPVFQGMRMDKKASAVQKEEPVQLKLMSKDSNMDQEPKLTNLGKIYWPKNSYTKGDLINYYRNVAEFILPYLKDRPVMIKRFPEGVEGFSFIQKDTKGLHLPSWVETIKIEHEKKDLTYFLIQNLKTLEYVANLGAIELHPFLSQTQKPNYPVYFAIDLDPESIDFEHVIEVAKRLHQVLDKIEVANFIKTSGKRGLHVCIPMNAKYTFDQALQFGEIIGRYLNEQLPEITSLIRQPSKRQHKVYLDVLQNHYKQTIIAPYSARGTELATVSTPLKWTEIKKGLNPNDYNIESVPKRLKKYGDLFSPTLKRGIDLKKILNNFSKLYL